MVCEQRFHFCFRFVVPDRLITTTATTTTIVIISIDYSYRVHHLKKLMSSWKVKGEFCYQTGGLPNAIFEQKTILTENKE